jgi:hypothetical protein
MIVITVAICSWVLVATLVLIGLHRRALVALWREPMLRAPVLIIESDDWGAGPREQAEQLGRIEATLASFSDRLGRKPVMTLGIVLGVADGPRMLADGLQSYYRKGLDEPAFAAILEAMKHGAKTGVFALQLHGQEHYWPPALLAAANSLPRVAAWLSGPEIPRTEMLPAWLQSRWIDAAALPSKPLRADEIRTAALAEVATFRNIFGNTPTVAVPPTFIWNDLVEAAWAEAGIRTVVTPGRRYEARDAQGDPIAVGPTIVNGDMGKGGVLYLVRDEYFEPARGHTAERALAALSSKTCVGRPTLLETHRANFLGDTVAADAAIGELDRLLTLARKAFPDVLFLCPEELASRMQEHDAQLVEWRLAIRLHIWLRRLWKLSRLRKLAWVTGVIVPGGLLFAGTWLRVHPVRHRRA